MCLAGCSSHDDRPDRKSLIYQEQLETKILPDGSKVFNFSLAMKPRMHSENNEQAIAGKPMKKGKRGGKGERKGSQKQQRSNQEPNKKNTKRAEALAERFETRLDNLKILKMFCRQGYFILEEYVESNKMSVKAECKEGASEDDYNKFTKT